MLTHDTVVAQLERRWERLQRAPLNGTSGPLDAYRRFVQGTPAFSDILATFEKHRPTMDAHLNQAIQLRGDWSAPPLRSDEEEAAFGWFLVMRFASGGAQDMFHSTIAQHALQRLGASESLTVRGDRVEIRRATSEGVRHAIEFYVGPTHAYLLEHLIADAVLLEHFERFAEWTRWFGHVEMQSVLDAEQTSGRSSHAWEHALRRRAVEWVFRDGVPLTRIDQEARSATGQTDLLVELQGRRRAIVEAKILGRFGPTTYGPADLVAAVNQLGTYVRDKAGPAFLLVFHNHPEEVLVEGPAVRSLPATPNSVLLTTKDGRHVGIVLARLLPPPRPSDGLTPLRLSSDVLLGG